ncbi:hypothetical protein BU15DRAFT_54783 [Melanogaster broomeanus]|nr:hypothetical protein BU15DRAFT_54783 [Melanogaster broomeanus]
MNSTTYCHYPSSECLPVTSCSTLSYVLASVDLKQHFEPHKVPHTVHRLDKATTGALVLPKDLTAARQLSLQIQNRTIGKTYLELVRRSEQSFSAQSGEISNPPMGVFSISRSCNTGSYQRRPCRCSALRLHTGLKYQPCVHLAHSLHSTSLHFNHQFLRTLYTPAVQSPPRSPIALKFLHAACLRFSRCHKTGPNKHFRLEVPAALPGNFVTLCKDAGRRLSDWDVIGGVFVYGEPAEMK